MRGLKLLALACAAGSAPAWAEPFQATTPTRVAAASGPATPVFHGTRSVFGPADAATADRFRAARIVVWSQTTKSRWVILPPVPFGRTGRSSSVPFDDWTLRPVDPATP